MRPFGNSIIFKTSFLKSSKGRSASAIEEFQQQIPVHDYDSIFDRWWSKARKGHKDVCWPGKVKYFALSSGTSGDSTKYIPAPR
ncbi:MAG: GH3 auxin-responsive promoter family protein [Cyclobacteriaceae bacterium]|nr:GH3 auxin-responsive promoter family protein [Cyclobacteriaceae bacterium]